MRGMNPILGIFIGGFAGGIALRSLVPTLGGESAFIFSTFLLFLSLLLFIFHMIGQSDLPLPAGRRPTYLFVVLVAVFIGAAGLGAAKIDLANLNQGDPYLEGVVGEEVILEGVVVDEADVRENNTRLMVRLEKVIISGEEGGTEVAVLSKALIVTEHYPEYFYGDEVRFEGRLLKPQNFRKSDDESGRSFDYISYLSKDEIFYQIYYPESDLLSSGGGNLIKRNLFSLKDLFLENVSRVIPDPHASLLGGVVLGAKRALGEDLLDDFRTTGIIHIVVLSGYNITVVAEAISRVTQFAPPLLRFALASLAIAGFAIMTGLGATIVRASIMAWLVLFAHTIGRASSITSLLFIAGFLMLLHNPKILIFDPSFQLSFLATLGLIYFSPLIERRITLIPKKYNLRGVFAATLATQIFVLPLLLYMMGEVSLVAVPVNLLILIFVPLTMLLGLLVAVSGLFGVALSLPFAYVAYLFLAYDLKVVELFAALPFASVTIPSFPVSWMLLVYLLYTFIIIKNFRVNTVDTI